MQIFFYNVPAEKLHYSVLWKWKVEKLVYGHIGSECAFLVNKDILSFNMEDITLKVFRTVHDEVKHMRCEIHEVLVSNDLLMSCKQSCQKYSAFLEDQKDQKVQ